MDDTGWIVIPNWPKFQHYANRDPLFLKEYRSQIDDADYRSLTLAERGLLHGLRLLYASSAGQVPHSPSELSGRLAAPVWRRHLEALSDAGLIAIVASKPPTLAGESASAHALAREEKKKRREERASAASKSTAERPRSNAAAYALHGQRASSGDECPACGVGGGRHLADCELAGETDPPAGELEPVAGTVDAELLGRMRGWIADHPPAEVVDPADRDEFGRGLGELDGLGELADEEPLF